MDQALMKQYQNWKLESDAENILWLTLDRVDSSVNSLNEAVMREFDQILNTLRDNRKAQALIIQSGKASGFIVGADINQFKKLKSAEQATDLIRKTHDTFNKLENLPMATIALISGACLGGGLELALACRYRIAEDSDKTRIGLPEVKLGIHPGWGGTVRLPALIGALKAMSMILTGRALRARAAKKMGVVDHVAPQRVLKASARQFALNAPKPHRAKAWERLTNAKWVRPLLKKLFLYQLKTKISQDHYPAPFNVVKNWAKYGVLRPDAMIGEAESIGHLLVSPTSRHLVNIFFLSERLKKLAPKDDFQPQHIHIVGAGVMGGDIAAWCALHGLNVTLQDQTSQLIGSAVKRTYQLAKKRLKAPEKIQACMDRLLPDPNGYGIKKADIIIEAITEKLEAKRALFESLEKEAKPEALFATNTSTIPLEEMSSGLSDPGRLVGLHFFNPVAQLPLIEVVHGKGVKPKTLKHAMHFVRLIDKFPLPVKSSPGFLVNRILLPYMLEAMKLLEEGVSPALIDKAAVNFGMPMGPVEMADAVGLDVCLMALEKFNQAFGGKIPDKLQAFVAQGDLGKKTGKGFYTYKKGKKVKSRKLSGQKAPSDLIDRLILRMLNEAMACLREGIVKDADLLDAACVFGFGFAPFRGGPITYARERGFERLQDQLKDLNARYGERFKIDIGWQDVA